MTMPDDCWSCTWAWLHTFTTVDFSSTCTLRTYSVHVHRM